MLVLTRHCIGAKHVHHLAVIRLALVQGSVFEQTMLFDPCAVDNDFRLLVGGGELGGDVGDTALFLHLLLNLLGNSPTCGIGLEAAGLHLVPDEDFRQPSVHDVGQTVITDAIVNIVVLPIHIRHREESVVSTLVLSVADTDDCVRVSFGSSKYRRSSSSE